jgi:hypothetical protein
LTPQPPGGFFVCQRSGHGPAGSGGRPGGRAGAVQAALTRSRPD